MGKDIGFVLLVGVGVVVGIVMTNMVQVSFNIFQWGHEGIEGELIWVTEGMMATKYGMWILVGLVVLMLFSLYMVKVIEKKEAAEVKRDVIIK